MSVLDGVTANVDSYLGRNKYIVDEDFAHIELNPAGSASDFEKLIRICPAGLYKYGSDGERLFDHAGCLECGTCRIAALGGVVDKWNYPHTGMGVQYRYG